MAASPRSILWRGATCRRTCWRTARRLRSRRATRRRRARSTSSKHARPRRSTATSNGNCAHTCPISGGSRGSARFKEEAPARFRSTRTAARVGRLLPSRGTPVRGLRPPRPRVGWRKTMSTARWPEIRAARCGRHSQRVV
jgi:hypothetical protein